MRQFHVCCHSNLLCRGLHAQLQRLHDGTDSEHTQAVCEPCLASLARAGVPAEDRECWPPCVECASNNLTCSLDSGSAPITTASAISETARLGSAIITTVRPTPLRPFTGPVVTTTRVTPTPLNP
jgi:hypothetical protein